MSQSVSRNFPGIFVIFGVFFVPLKQFLQFMELFLALKINSKKNYSIGLGRACGLTQPARARAGPAGQARQGPSAEAGHGCRRRRSVDLGVRAWPASAPIKARPGTPRACPSSAALRALAAAPPPPAPHRLGAPPPRRTKPSALTRDSGRFRRSPRVVSTSSNSP
jgi:hypothetical protein